MAQSDIPIGDEVECLRVARKVVSSSPARGTHALGLQMAHSAGWVCDLCLWGQTDKMTVTDTVTVTSGRGQLWRGDRPLCDLV